MVEPNTGSLLLWAFQDFERDLVAGLREAGHEAIRPKHGAVLANIEVAGTRATLLADRAGMTKASMGEVIDELERSGYVQRRPDPSDRRAKLVVPTEAGIIVTQLAAQLIEEIELGYRRKLGERRYRALRAALSTIAEQPEGRGAQPHIR